MMRRSFIRFHISTRTLLASCVAACLLGLMVACTLGVLGVRNGSVTPRMFSGQLGALRIIGYPTWNANCPPYVGCDPTLHQSYVVWVIVGTQLPDTQPYRLIRLPIEHESTP